MLSDRIQRENLNEHVLRRIKQPEDKTNTTKHNS